MRKFAAIMLCCVLLCGCNSDNDTDNEVSDRLENMRSASVMPVVQDKIECQDDNIDNTLNYDFQKGIWLSYIDLAPMLFCGEESFKREFKQACEKITELGFNTIYVHARPFGDALYSSELYPASNYISQTNDKADFDMLEIVCDTAHEYELSVHAWINPLRCQTAEEFENIDDSFLTKKWYSEKNDYLQSVEGSINLWLNPAYDEVRELIACGAAEIAENYNVDGIHYDDYFYPTTDESFDNECYAAMSDGEDLDSWRMDNISEMCAEIYSAVKAVNENIQVGISPQGNIENNYEFMYADVKKWCADEGYCDYILPQIYFGYENSVKPFTLTLQDWCEITMEGDVELVIGLGAYKIGDEQEFTDTVGIIAQQIEDVFSNENCSGAAVYTYNSLFSPDSQLSARINKECESIKDVFSHLK